MASRSLAWSLGVYSFTGFLGLHLGFLSPVLTVRIVGKLGPPLVILIGARSAIFASLISSSEWVSPIYVVTQPQSIPPILTPLLAKILAHILDVLAMSSDGYKALTSRLPINISPGG